MGARGSHAVRALGLYRRISAGLKRMAQKLIDLRPDNPNKSLIWRLCKVTTSSTEGAAPYTSTGNIYRGRYLDEETDRTKDIEGVSIWTAHATQGSEWLLAVKTPFGHWEGVSFYEWVKINQQGWMYAYGFSSSVEATTQAAYASAYSELEADTFQDLPPSSLYAESSDYIIDEDGGYVSGLTRGVIRYECGDYAGRRLRRVRCAFIYISTFSTKLAGLNYRIGIYTSDTIPTQIGSWQTADGDLEITWDSGSDVQTYGQIKCDIELKTYLFISVIIDEATNPSETGSVLMRPWDLNQVPPMRISIGLEPEP